MDLAGLRICAGLPPECKNLALVLGCNGAELASAQCHLLLVGKNGLARVRGLLSSGAAA